MTWEQFWDGDARMPKYYRQADEMRKRRKNEELWLQGAYVYEAIADLVPVLHAFAKKGAKPQPYLEEPYALTKAEVSDRAEKTKRREYDKKMAKVASWAAAVNQKFAKKEVAENG